MRVKLFLSGLVVVDSTSDDPRVLNSSHSTLWRQWSLVAHKSWYRDVSRYDCFGTIYRIVPGIMNQFEYIKILEERDYVAVYRRGNAPQQDKVFQHPRTSEQHLGSRQKQHWGNGVASSIPRPQPLCIFNVTSHIFSFVKQTPKIQRNRGM